MRALDLKLLRDLYRLWAQSLAIALVMACGAATLILAVGAHRSLEQTRAAYYEQYRFGDLFASAVRAPRSLTARIEAIDGVAAVETRIVETALLDIEGMREPATAQLISLPPDADLAVNAVFLKSGRFPQLGRSREIVVNFNFAEAHGFEPGATLGATIGSAKVELTIVGVVFSPEFIYALGPGAMMPDNRRFGAFWMPEDTLAELTDLQGAFNSASLRILPGIDAAKVIERLDALLAPYGGRGAIERKDQQSNAFLEGELDQLGAMGAIIPPVFLAISAFLINMILSRLVTLEREQIGLLKALGYGRLAVVAHYLKLVLVIAAAGVVIGSIAGTWLGHGMTVLYSRFYSFPFLIFDMSPRIYLIAAGVTAAAATLGAVQAIRTAFSLPAAVAMRQPAPPTYHRLSGGLLERFAIFSQLTVMAVRQLVRHPVRSMLTAVGTAASVGLMTLALGTISSVDFMVDAVFFRTDRQDATLNFSAARSPAALNDVAHLPGVMRVEPFLAAPVRISSGQHSRDLVITGKPASSDLSRVLDVAFNPVALTEGGLALSDRVASVLDVRTGDFVEVEFLDGEKRRVDVAVADVIQSYLGMMVFMEIDSLARLAGTGPRVSGAHLLVDPARLDELYGRLKDTPGIGAIALQTIARQSFQDTMRQNIFLMLTVYVTLSVIIAFGVVYNTARIQLSERARELATLRVLGFGRREVSNVLLIEIGAIIVVAQPLGWLIGSLLMWLIIDALATDLFRVPMVIDSRAFAIASGVVVTAALVSAFIVRRRIDRLDLVRVLKSRE